jgi:hypothetical protein
MRHGSWRDKVVTRGWAGLGLMLAVLLLAPSAARAATITVDSTADPTASGCTLHDAITAANTNAVVIGSSCAAGSGTADTIDFNLPNPSTITLVGALPNITTNLSLTGPGPGPLTITGNDLYRPINVSVGGVTVNISGLTVTHGLCDNACFGFGGGIANAGTMTLTDVVVSNSTASESGGLNAFPEGGGIYNQGTLTLTLSTVGSNLASATGATSQNGAAGGGIFNQGTLTTDRSTVSDNASTAVAGVGGTTNTRGGGINNRGTLNVSRSTLSANTASATASSSGNSAAGGAISNANSASVNVTIDRSTVSGNTVSADAPANAQAGGFNVFGTTFSVRSSTIAGNSAPLGSNAVLGSPATVKNTIVSDPLGGGANCSGVAISQGFNLTDGTGCGFTQATDHPSTDPMLGALADNGGPTQTLALLTGSPAIDAGVSSVGETADQRGLTRPLDLAAVSNAPGSDGTDVGAFEVQGPAVTPPPTGNPPSAPAAVAPDTSLSARIKKAKRKATFTFGSSDGSSTFMCKLDKRTLAPCTSPVTFKHLRIGKHTFMVEAVNAAGPDPSPATFRFRLKP